jgi:hypothetical protein
LKEIQTRIGPIVATGDVQDLVTALYLDVLGRAPDAAGLSHWVAQLQSGSSQQQLAQAFWQSAEHRTLEVTSYYDTLLKRTPDAVGLTQWVQMLENGASERAVQFGFLTSQEYLAQHSTPGTFLSALYEDVLGRAASVAEIASWQNQALPAKAGLIVSDFLYSAEASTHLIDQQYSKLLERSVDPVGEAYWLAAVQSGASPTALAEAILSSGEYFTLAASS